MAIRTVGLAVLLLGLLIGVAFGLTALDLEGLFRSLIGERQTAHETSQTAVRSDARQARSIASEGIEDRMTELAGQLGSRQSAGAAGVKGQPSFDIARISPDGVSVFAGRAKPFERVNVQVGDLVVGTTNADGDGNWTLVTEKRIPDISGELQLTTGVNTRPLDDTGAREAAGKPATAASLDRAAPRTAKEVNTRLVASLKGLVDEARAQRQGERPAEISDAATSTSQTASSTPAQELQQFAKTEPAVGSQPAALASSGPGSPQKAESRAIPIPVQFVYREAEFTKEGREAVGLLLEYLKLAGLDSVTLSGHADERGSSDLNIELSRERLNAVRDVLRDGGYSGELTLVPKGESEPFTGVDRSALPLEELYQLDRRVELHLED